jgi:hypothetical protein
VNELTAEQVVHNFVSPLYTNVSILEPCEVEERIQTQDELQLKEQARIAGFDNIANMMEKEYYIDKEKENSAKRCEEEKRIISEAMQKLNLKILLKVPSFAKTLVGKFETTTFYREMSFERAVLVGETSRTESKKTFFNKIQSQIFKNQVYMVEVSASSYKGAIPPFAIKATAQAVKAGLEPKVWIAGTEAELKDYVTTITTYKPVPIDPLVVGYAKGQMYFDHCVLISAWGKDLEEIDSYFK